MEHTNKEDWAVINDNKSLWKAIEDNNKILNNHDLSHSHFIYEQKI